MHRFIMVLTLGLLSIPAFAQDLTCLNKLLGFNRFTGHHHLPKEEWNDGRDMLNPENTMIALEALVRFKLMCKEGEMTVKVGAVCSQVLADIPQSNVCYVHTNLGYFVMSRDGGRNVNFIFSKDKRFADPKL
ncbi:MAG TPA: hypothetical protein VNJ08_02285 [Bacteriovoracaceae bacterium]|nr:hypothetical protein [Bacteriovoracaceae bacterium]